MSFLSALFGRRPLRATEEERALALGMPALSELDDADAVVTMVIGGKETRGALPVESVLLEGAVYSSRGRAYAHYNEDAAGLVKDAAGRFYGFVLDQAGGLGGKVRGEGSGLAAKRIFRAMKTLGDPSPAVLDVIQAAYDDAHTTLYDREQGEVTTAVTAIISNDRAYVLNSGDSGAFHFDGDGKMKAATEMQELQAPNEGCLQHALGLMPEGCKPDRYEWSLQPGDWVLLATDGLLDSGLDQDTLGSFLTESDSVEDAVNELCATILRRMGSFRSKPDNLTVVLVRVKREQETA